MALIFQKSVKNRRAPIHASTNAAPTSDINARFLRQEAPLLPEVSELDVVRHYTKLSQQNFSVDTHYYPLGSCTMKYNPRALQKLAVLPGFANRHPYALPEFSQGFMSCLFDLQEYLKVITGMCGVALNPMAGAHGELAGVLMMRAYHAARGDTARTEIIVPDAAHGTNPASASMGHYTIKEIATNAEGDLDLAALKAAVGPQTAGIMLTNPSTLGVFERNISEIARIVHAAGGLLYYDGANLNAILGKARPGDMGFDVIHLNLHKTFGTPHGGGGPGSGPVAVSERMLPYLPVPLVAKQNDKYVWLTEKELPQTIGCLSAFAGNAGILLRAYVYLRLLGREGLPRVAEYAALNSNYLARVLERAGFTLAYPKRLTSHEFIVTLKKEAKEFAINAKDFGKRLLDYGFHAPTTYFPILVPECLLIEPTETESKQEIDAFAQAMATILGEAKNDPEKLRQAPFTTPVRRLDDVKAARELDVRWVPKSSE